MYELNGWTFDPNSTKRPMIFARCTQDIINDRLAPGILAELQRVLWSLMQQRPPLQAISSYLTTRSGMSGLKAHLAGVLASMLSAGS